MYIGFALGWIGLVSENLPEFDKRKANWTYILRFDADRRTPSQIERHSVIKNRPIRAILVLRTLGGESNGCQA